MDKAVSDQKTDNATTALQQSEERLRMFIAASSNLVYRMNADWTRMEHLVGKELLADTPKPITGWMDKYLLPEDQPDVQSVIQEAINTKLVYNWNTGSYWQMAVEQTDLYSTEFRVLREDHQVRWMNGYGRVVDKKARCANRMVGVMFDITNRKMLEQQKEDFIGIASHELKTPVTSIKAYAEMLLDILNRSRRSGPCRPDEEDEHPA